MTFNEADHPRDHGTFTDKPQSRPDAAALAWPPQLAGADLPTISLEGLTHIGSLEPGDKNGWSLEGQGLSVSQHPEAWGRIARLGGPVWSLPMDEAKFLDFHELNDEQRTAMDDFGVERGYTELATAYRVTYYDDEAEEERWITCGTREEALGEAAEYADQDLADEDGEISDADLVGLITEVTVMKATAAFPDSTVKTGSTEIDEIVATVYVNEMLPDYDGVWWADRLDPVQLSAPRGVIVPSKIAGWIGTVTPYAGGADPDDDDR
jgi:hypothetical protein